MSEGLRFIRYLRWRTTMLVVIDIKLPLKIGNHTIQEIIAVKAHIRNSHRGQSPDGLPFSPQSPQGLAPIFGVVRRYDLVLIILPYSFATLGNASERSCVKMFC